MISEDQIEQLCLDWFRGGVYEHAIGCDIANDDVPQSVAKGVA